jgi:ubiquinone/menaquinone biosynthesis C-methylase UbiE
VLSYAKDVFPHLTEWFMDNPAINERRRTVLEDVQGDVLEIGFGSGLNLKYYRSGVSRLVALDPSRRAFALADKRLRTTAFPVELVEGTGEEMSFPAGTFDAVVLAWTLCSVMDPARTLENIRRVLRPGGRLHFLEHGLSEEPRVRAAQRFWAPVHRKLCAGCRLTLQVDNEVANAGLSIVSLRKGHIARPKILSYVYEGVAEKPAHS